MPNITRTRTSKGRPGKQVTRTDTYDPCVMQSSAECLSHHPQGGAGKDGYYKQSNQLNGSSCDSCVHLKINAMKKNKSIFYTPDPNRPTFVLADFSKSAGKSVKWTKRGSRDIPPMELRQPNEQMRALNELLNKRSSEYQQQNMDSVLANKRARDSKKKSESTIRSKSCDLYISLSFLLTKYLLFIIYCILLIRYCLEGQGY